MTQRRLKVNIKTLDKELEDCESYMSKIYKGKQEPKSKVSTGDKKIYKTAFVTTPSNKLTAKNQVDVVKNTTGSGAAVTTATTPHPPKQQTHIIRKEVFSNPSATVEVVVKTSKGGTHKRSRSGSRSSSSSQYNTPWNKVLESGASTDNTNKDHNKNPNSFDHFDPMRTLRFLTKELRNKLGHICPGDPGVQQMVVDIEHALHRLPVGAGDKKSLDGIRTNFTNRDNLSSNVSPRSDCPTQPTHEYQSTELMQQNLEDSLLRLEDTCRQLEEQCNQLRLEKAEIQVLYKNEQSSLQDLKEKFDSIERQKTALEIKSTTELLKLQSERDILQQENESLKSKIGSRQSLIDQDSRMLIQQLKSQNSVLEESHMNVLTELTELKMERDKLNVLLESRDSQLDQLRKELLAVQSLIREQLIELKNRNSRDISSDVSSSTLGDQDGVDKAIDKIVAEAKTKTTTSHAIQEYLIVKNKTIEELSTKAQDMLSKAIAERNRLLGMDLPISELAMTTPDTVELFHSFNESDRAVTDVSSIKSYPERKNKVIKVHVDKDSSSHNKEKVHHDHESSLEIITPEAAQLENKRSVRDIMTGIRKQAKRNVEATLRLPSKDASSYEENSDVWVDASPKIPSEWDH